LEIGNVVIGSTIVLQCVCVTIRIVEEVEGIIAVGFAEQFATCIQVSMRCTVYSLIGTKAISIIAMSCEDHCETSHVE
jgi:hypothetical protein